MDCTQLVADHSVPAFYRIDSPGATVLLVDSAARLEAVRCSVSAAIRAPLVHAGLNLWLLAGSSSRAAACAGWMQSALLRCAPLRPVCH